jgi:hypothetical protein
MVNQRGYNTLTVNLDRLCRYFRCSLGQLAEYVPDEELAPRSQSVAKAVVTETVQRVVTRERFAGGYFFGNCITLVLTARATIDRYLVPREMLRGIGPALSTCRLAGGHVAMAA